MLEDSRKNNQQNNLISPLGLPRDESNEAKQKSLVD
jgi:hypothetical protein